MAGFNMKDLLNEKSKGEAKAEKPVIEIRQIPIGKIVPSEKNHYSVDAIDKMAESIEEVGLLHNLVVKEADENGNFEIISGERRFRACKMLLEGGNKQFAVLPCKVEVSSEDLINELRLLFANSTAREISDYDKMVQAIRTKEILLQLKKSGHKFKGRMRENVAEAVGVSPAQMGRFESIHKNLDSGNMEAFKAGKIGITEAYELSTAKAEPEAENTKKSADAGGTTEAVKPITEKQAETKVLEEQQSAQGIDTDGIARAIEQMSVDQLTQLTKVCMQQLLQRAIAKSSLAYVCPEAQAILREVSPSLLAPLVPALAYADGE